MTTFTAPSAQQLARGLAKRLPGCLKSPSGATVSGTWIRHRLAFVQILYGSEIARLLRDLGNDLLELVSLGRRDPREANPPHIEAQQIEQVAKEHPPAPRVKVAAVVVAIAGMTARYEHGIGLHLKGLHQQVEIDAAGAWQPHDAHVGRILQPRRSRQVGRQVGAPVANECDDLRLESVGLAHIRLATMA